jgi:hypothetical protein
MRGRRLPAVNEDFCVIHVEHNQRVDSLASPNSRRRPYLALQGLLKKRKGTQQRKPHNNVGKDVATTAGTCQ